jgi:hypothetical protein
VIADWAAGLDRRRGQRLGSIGRVPAGSTVWRFLVRVDATGLQAVLACWLRCRLPVQPAKPGPPGSRRTSPPKFCDNIP